MNITVDSTRKMIDMSAKSYGWDSWLKVREDIQLAKTLTDAEREHRIYYVRCPEDTRNLFWLTPQTRHGRRIPLRVGWKLGLAWQGSNPKNSELDSAIRHLPETPLPSPCVPFDVATEPVESCVRHQERHSVGSESNRETEAAPAARIPRDSALRASCIPAHERNPDG